MSNLPNANDNRSRVARRIRWLIDAKRDKEALRELNDLPRKLREDAELLFYRAVVLERFHVYNEAIECARASLKGSEHVDKMLLIAGCYRGLGETEKAIRWCDRAERFAPDLPLVSFVRGRVLEEAGRFEEATELLGPFVEAHDREGTPYPMGLAVEWSKLLVQHKKYPEAIKLIDQILEDPSVPAHGRAHELYLKAKAADRMHDYDSAFAWAGQGNAIGQFEFDPGIYEEQVTALIENWSRETMKDFPLSKCDAELPVFVAGMPRSGTSLIDQIVDAHPKAAGVGELASVEKFAGQLSSQFDPDLPAPECFGRFQERQWTRVANAYVRELKRLAPGMDRVVNKALGNNRLVGLIARLFPKTRIIHAIRDPRDVAISCYLGGFNNRMHPWTTRVEWVAAAWEQSQRMMQHWKDTLDVPILDVHYERLVGDPQHEFPRLIEFLGLEWDDRVFDFHKTRRTVRTLSYDQVNRPLYKSSSGRHANYAKFIEGVEFPAYDPWAAD